MPATFYSVIKYVPDPVADESINVGVAVFSGRRVRLAFTSEWNRARQLAARDPKALKRVVADLATQEKQGALSEEVIRRYAESWRNQVQWTPPRASVKDLDQLISEVSSLYLPRFATDAVKAVRRPGKRRAIRIAITELTNQLTAKLHAPRRKARQLLKTDHVAAGKYEQHQLDLAIVNGHLKAGAFALSFAVANKQQLKRDIDAVAFGVEDVIRQQRRVPMFVLGYTEDPNGDDVKRAQALFNQLNSTFVPNSRIPAWSKTLVRDFVGDDLFE